jgi:hypothetical protein
VLTVIAALPASLNPTSQHLKSLEARRRTLRELLHRLTSFKRALRQRLVVHLQRVDSRLLEGVALVPQPLNYLIAEAGSGALSIRVIARLKIASKAARWRRMDSRSASITFGYAPNCRK